MFTVGPHSPQYLPSNQTWLYSGSVPIREPNGHNSITQERTCRAVVLGSHRLDHGGGTKDAVPELQRAGTGRLEFLREVRDLTAAHLLLLRSRGGSR
jgi:hypothetical protein